MSAEENYRNALDRIRLLASIHYLGQAFDPEHMWDIATLAISALNGKEIPGVDYDGALDRALDFHWFGDEDEVEQVDESATEPPPLYDRDEVMGAEPLEESFLEGYQEGRYGIFPGSGEMYRG